MVLMIGGFGVEDCRLGLGVVYVRCEGVLWIMGLMLRTGKVC